jgi:hypothetical protein
MGAYFDVILLVKSRNKLNYMQIPGDWQPNFNGFCEQNLLDCLFAKIDV